MLTLTSAATIALAVEYNIIDSANRRFAYLAPGGFSRYDLLYRVAAENRWEMMFALTVIIVVVTLGAVAWPRTRTRAVWAPVVLQVAIMIYDVATNGWGAASAWVVISVVLVVALVILGEVGAPEIVRMLRSSPVALPATVLVLLALAFMSDVWKVAQAAGGWRLAAFGAVVVAPLFGYNVAAIFAEAAKSGPSLNSLAPSDRAGQTERTPGDLFRAPLFARTRLWVVPRRAVRRLCALSATAFGVVSTYIYVATSVLVQPGVAAQWANVPRAGAVHLFNGGDRDAGITLRTSPYTSVALLFGILAVAVLMATNLTSHAGAITPARLINDQVEVGDGLPPDS